LTSLFDTSVLVGPLAPELGEHWLVSAVSVGELQAGVLLAGDEVARSERLRRLSVVLASAPVVPVEGQVAARYAELRAASGRRPANDLWIAATALAHDLTLLTADQRQASLPLVRARLIASDGLA
jgi:predicted nucleic acid-binding protein